MPWLQVWDPLGSSRVGQCDHCPSESMSCPWPAAGAEVSQGRKSHPSSIPGSCGMWHWVIPGLWKGILAGGAVSLGAPVGFLGDAESFPGFSQVVPLVLALEEFHSWLVQLHVKTTAIQAVLENQEEQALFFLPGGSIPSIPCRW